MKMRPDKESTSFTFHRNIFSSSNTNSNDATSVKLNNCRRKLQDKFNEEKNCGDDQENANKSGNESDRSVLSVLNLNISLSDTRKLLREGADKISKTFSNVRTTLGSFSQKFKMPTKRRQILEEGPMTPNPTTPQTMTRTILGRTPTKLYSPFCVESPYASTTTSVNVNDKENMIPHNKSYIPWMK